MMPLYDYQLDALKRMKRGCILCGDVGSGKSRTALAYYYLKNGGDIECLKGNENYIPLKSPKKLYIITTARKRDTLEWEGEMAPFLFSPKDVVVDSWNNIKKYQDVIDAFFIFDEQRVVGNGAWVKAFEKIARGNFWILLTATPGDTWMDYIPVFIANGFYKNKSEFRREHVIYSRFTKYPKVDHYINTGRLIKYRNQILVKMDYKKKTNQHHEDVYADYDISTYKEVGKTRWDPFKQEPITDAGALCYVWRRIVNSSDDRKVKLLEILDEHPKAIIFYNFDYELEILKEVCNESGTEFSEWNGHKHQKLPGSGDNGPSRWVYLVQYTAGAEGWNCTATDTIIFYSQNYSYKITTQAAGRIDRLNTPYQDLYYYHLKSRSKIDMAISQALSKKKNFNESQFVNGGK